MEYVSIPCLIRWGVFRPSRKDLLNIYIFVCIYIYTVQISISLHLEKKNCSSAFASFVDTASKIFCRFNCSSLANRSMDSSLGGKKERWGKTCWGLFNPSQFKIKTERCLMMMNLFHPLKHVLTVAVRARLFMLQSDSCSTFLTVCQI